MSFGEIAPKIPARGRAVIAGGGGGGTNPDITVTTTGVGIGVGVAVNGNLNSVSLGGDSVNEYQSGLDADNPPENSFVACGATTEYSYSNAFGPYSEIVNRSQTIFHTDYNGTPASRNETGIFFMNRTGVNDGSFKVNCIPTRTNNGTWLPPDTMTYINADILIRQQNDNSVVAYTYKGILKKDNAGSITIMGTPVVTQEVINDPNSDFTSLSIAITKSDDIAGSGNETWAFEISGNNNSITLWVAITVRYTCTGYS
jgi:hypothetical protein